MEVLKLQIFYENFETHDILWRFQNLWYFTEVSKPMVFYGGFETYGILWRFWNSWYFANVFKPMVLYGGFKRLFLRFKTSENTFPIDGLTKETVTVGKWLKWVFNLGNVKINPH